MKIEILSSDQGYYICVDGHRINDFTTHPPKDGTVIKLLCPISSQEVDIERMFADGILEFVDSPYKSDIFTFHENADYFLLAVFKQQQLTEENNAN
tara:strand:+ start:496 stop:783 length:288 start_codon:yes stop_codon:yes gene_type:complete